MKEQIIFWCGVLAYCLIIWYFFIGYMLKICQSLIIVPNIMPGL